MNTDIFKIVHTLHYWMKSCFGDLKTIDFAFEGSARPCFPTKK